MARYTEKSYADMAWDEIRRTVQYRVNLAAATFRAEILNQILPPLQDKFEIALAKGVLLELDADMSENIKGIVETAVGELTA